MDIKDLPVFQIPEKTESSKHAIPRCLHSSPRGTECVLYAHHTGLHSWDNAEPLTKINPANKEEKDFWENCFTMLLQPSSDIVTVAKRADEALQEYRKRLAHP